MAPNILTLSAPECATSHCLPSTQYGALDILNGGEERVIWCDKAGDSPAQLLTAHSTSTARFETFKVNTKLLHFYVRGKLDCCYSSVLLSAQS